MRNKGSEEEESDDDIPDDVDLNDPFFAEENGESKSAKHKKKKRSKKRKHEGKLDLNCYVTQCLQENMGVFHFKEPGHFSMLEQ